MEDPADLVEWRSPLLVQIVNAVGLGDFLAGGDPGRSAEEIAEHTGWRPDLATRVLRALLPRGLFRCDEDGRWQLTERGQVLRSDHPDSLAAARFSGFEIGGWTRMLQTLRTGQPSFPATFGSSFWDWLAVHPDDRAAFDEKMRGRLASALEMVATYPWPEQGHLVDVGGGTGALVADVLGRRPGMTATLLDLPEATDRARALLTAAGVADRCTLVAGSFFESVPAGGDLYVLSQIVHDWPDDDGVRILEQVRAAMLPTGRVLLLEGVLPDGDEASALGLLDLHMLAMFGAGERDREQWRTLLERAGLRLDRVVEGPYVSWVEAVRA